MAYNYGDANGWLHHGPSIGGAKALIEELNANHDSRLYPNVKELLATGECSNTELVAGEAKRLAAKIKDPAIQETLLHMARAASKATDHIAITH